MYRQTSWSIHLSSMLVACLLTLPAAVYAGHDDVMRDFMEDEDRHEHSMDHDRADKNHDRHEHSMDHDRADKNHDRHEQTMGHDSKKQKNHDRHYGENASEDRMWGDADKGRRSLMGTKGPRHLARMLAELDLNQNQKRKIRKIYRHVRKENMRLKTHMIEFSDRLADLYAEEKLNVERISRVYDKIFSYRVKMIKNHLRALNKMRKVLDRNQREKFHDLRQEYDIR